LFIDSINYVVYRLDQLCCLSTRSTMLFIDSINYVVYQLDQLCVLSTRSTVFIDSMGYWLAGQNRALDFA